MRSLLVVTVVVLASASAELDFSSFESLDLSSSDVIQRIHVGLDCPETATFAGEVTKIQWTIEPIDNEAVILSSQPPGLVDASVNATTGVLRFNYNNVSFATHPGGAGVRIQVPAHQLRVVAAVGRAFSARVLAGFTNPTNVIVDSIAATLDVQGDATNSIRPLLLLSGVGESNLLRIGNSRATTTGSHIVQLDFGGRYTSMFVFGSTIGGNSILSSQACNLYANEPIEQLTLGGQSNSVSTKVGCDNVEILEGSSSTCSEVGADNSMEFIFPDMDSAVSTTVFTFDCGGGSSSAVQQSGSMFGFLAAFLWYTLF